MGQTEFLLLISVSLLLNSALVALPLAVVLTLALVRLLRGRIARAMKAATAAAETDAKPPPPAEPQGRLEIETILATPERARAARLAALPSIARRQLWLLAASYAAAAGVYPLVAAVGLISVTSFSPTSEVVLRYILLYLVFVIALYAPPVLAFTMIVRKHPRFLAGAVLSLLALQVLIGALLGDPTTVVLTWLFTQAIPTAAILFLSTRRLRVIGPLVYAALAFAFYGLSIGLTYATFHALSIVQPRPLLHAGSGELPWEAAMLNFAEWFLSLSLPEMLNVVAMYQADPSAFFHFPSDDSLTVGAWLAVALILLAPTAAVVGGAGTFVHWLTRRYRLRRAGDQMVAIDVLMVLFAAPAFLIGVVSMGWTAAASALVGFAGYRLASAKCLRLARESHPPFSPRTLLLLRVFGFDRRTQWLLEDLGQRWRLLGPIRLIAGPDVAYTTVEPHEFLAFLSGKLTSIFVRDRQHLEEHVRENRPRPDPDGTFRIEDFFCYESTWRMTVERLARDAEAILMDLRGFTAAREGCRYEIQQLVAAVPLGRVVLLVDSSTDNAALEEALQHAWRTMPAGSPNATGTQRLRVLHASRHGRTLDVLMDLLCSTGPAEPVRCPSGQASAEMAG